MSCDDPKTQQNQHLNRMSDTQTQEGDLNKGRDWKMLLFNVLLVLLEKSFFVCFFHLPLQCNVQILMNKDIHS